MSDTSKDIMTALLLLGLAGFGWLQTDGLSSASGMFPRLAIGLLAFLSGLYLLRTVALAKTSRVAGPGDEHGETATKTEGPFFTHPLRFFASLVLIIGYITVFPIIGYFTATLIFIPLFVLGIGGGRPVVAIATGFGFVVFSYVVFVLLLRRHLPEDFLLGFVL